MECIQDACVSFGRDMLLRTQQSFLQSVEKLIEVGGHYFEHLLH